MNNNPNLPESINLSKLGYNFDKLYFIEELVKVVTGVENEDQKGQDDAPVDEEEQDVEQQIDEETK